MARSSLTREEVLEAAAALVRQHGPDALTMRKLAAELGTAVTSIYWHVGNRESLLDALVERTVQEMGAVRPAGRTPGAPIVSVAPGLRPEQRAPPHHNGTAHLRTPDTICIISYSLISYENRSDVVCV
ncbi:TetR/AcrR family transcriptional regulator, partial [Streptomyces sp. 900116325]